MPYSQTEIVNPVDAEDVGAWLRSMTGVFLGNPYGPSVERWIKVHERRRDPARTWGARDRGRWVGTLRTHPLAITVPGLDGSTRELTADALTNVTVSATHRRRGLLTGMLGASLAAARERGDAVGILIAAEWPIYGRFGYAPATWTADYVLHRRRVTLPAGAEPGRVRVSDPAETAAIGAEVFAAFQRRRAGQTARDQMWWDVRYGQDGFPAPDPGDSPHNHLVHEDDTGAIDGMLAWTATLDAPFNPPAGKVTVAGLFAANDTAERDMWAYLAGIDLIDEITLTHRPVDEPAPWLLGDGRALVLKDQHDWLWLRLIDLPAALCERRYAVDGELVLEVTDDAPAGGIDVTGRYALRAAGDTVECTPTDRPADLALTQRALASTYLGGVSPVRLAATDTISELRPGRLELMRLMFSTPLAPWNATSF